jgi:hypothetical protein
MFTVASPDPHPDQRPDAFAVWQQLDRGTQIGLCVAGALLLMALLLIVTPRPGALQIGAGLVPTADILTPAPTAPPAPAGTSEPASQSESEASSTASVEGSQGVLRADGASEIALYWEPNKAEATRLPAGTTVRLIGFWDDWVAVGTPYLTQPLWVPFANVEASTETVAALRDMKPQPTAAPALSRPQPAPAWSPPAPTNTPSDLIALPTDVLVLPTRAPGAPAECVRTNGGGMCPAMPIPTMDPNATWPSQINVNP